MKYNLLKEKITFAIFLFINVGFAFNCFTFALRDIKIETTIERIQVPEKSKSFYELNGIEELPKKNNSSILRFSIPAKFLCVAFSLQIESYDANEFKECNESGNGKSELVFFKGDFVFEYNYSDIDIALHSEYPQFLFFQINSPKSQLRIYEKDINGIFFPLPFSLFEYTKFKEIFKKESQKVKIYKSPTLFYIYHSSNNAKYPIIVGFTENLPIRKKQSIVRLYWDMELIKDEKEFQKLFWIFAHPFAIAIDIITLPLQAMMYALGLILYIMLK